MIPDRVSGRFAWAATFLLCGALAAWIVLSQQLSYVQSDGLQRIFASLYAWTPYTWGESRYGMLVPLLAAPIRSPIANLLFQQLANTFLVLLFPFLLARWLVGLEGWIVTGALTDVLLLLVLRPWGISFLANELPYSTAGCLALAGALLLERSGKRAAAGALICWLAACWMTPSALFWAVPLYLLRTRIPGEASATPRPRASRALLTVALMTLAAIGIALTGRLVPIDDPTPLGLSPRVEWAETWSALARQVLTLLPPRLTVGLVLLVAVLVLAPRELLARFSWGERARALALVSLATAAFELFAVGLLRWVAYNEAFTNMGWRYVAIGVHLVCFVVPAVAGLAVAALRTAPTRGAAALLSLAALAIVVAWLYGSPAPSRGRAALAYCSHQALALDEPAHAVIDSGASFVAGDYWKVYPLVFRVNSILYESGERRIVWPLTDRAEAAARRWRSVDWSKVTVASLPGDPWIEWCRRHFDLPPLERVDGPLGIDLYRAAR